MRAVRWPREQVESKKKWYKHQIYFSNEIIFISFVVSKVGETVEYISFMSLLMIEKSYVCPLRLFVSILKMDYLSI